MQVFHGGGLTLELNPTTFGVERVSIQGDASAFSWVKGNTFALPSGNNFLLKKDFSRPDRFQAEFLYFSDVTATLTVEEHDGSVRFHYLFRNEGKAPVSFQEGELGAYFPFNDDFDISSVVLKRRAHAFVRTEGALAYIRTVRMSAEPCALALVLTKGECLSYSTELNAFRAGRGEIALNVPALTLEAGQTYEWEFVLFLYEDQADFDRHLNGLGVPTAEAPNLVLSEGESLIVHSSFGKVLRVENTEYPFTDGECRLPVTGEGEHIATVSDGERNVRLRYFVLSNAVAERRTERLLSDFSTKESGDEPGAASVLWLLSQAKEGNALAAKVPDWAAIAERQRAKLASPRGLFGRKKDPAYNIGLFAAIKYESYLCEKDVVALLESALLCSIAFKEFFCPITPVCRVIDALRKEGKDSVAKELADAAAEAADAILADGNKCADEKPFSPFDLCGALYLLSDAYLLTKQAYYLMNAKEHLARVSAFLSPSLDYRTHDVPQLIAKDAGLELSYDMSPTTKNAAFALAFERYARASGEKKYLTLARSVLTASLSLYDDKGGLARGRAIPLSVNGSSELLRDEKSCGEDSVLYLINLLFERD